MPSGAGRAAAAPLSMHGCLRSCRPDAGFAPNALIRWRAGSSRVGRLVLAKHHNFARDSCLVSGSQRKRSDVHEQKLKRAAGRGGCKATHALPPPSRPMRQPHATELRPLQEQRQEPGVYGTDKSEERRAR